MSPTSAARRIADDCLALGVRPGGLLLVHASFKSLGLPREALPAVFEGLRLALGPEGTLLLPALSWVHVHAGQPVFDVRHTPTCIGILPEVFRGMPGVRRSLHPTHSVCGIGPLADRVLSGHELDTTPVGPHSPFRALRDLGGQALMLGCGLRPSTSMHGVEETVDAPYLFCGTVDYTLVDEDGRRIPMTCRRHDFHDHVQRYDRLIDVLGPGELARGPVLEADSFLIEAPAMWARGAERMRREPYFFVDPLQ